MLKRTGFFHIIARCKSNIIIFICSGQGEQHLGHPQKHILGQVWGSKQLKGGAVWEVSKFRKLSNYMLLFTLSNCVFTCIFLKH